MSWLPPKTDWVITDNFNIQDYNRIVGNMYYLYKLAEELFRSFEIEGMVKEKQYYSMLYAREFNAIENNLETINIKSYNHDIGAKEVYRSNQPVPLFSEYNRIESAQLKLFNSLYGHWSIRQHLEFTLGSDAIGKRVRYSKEEIISHRLAWKLSKDRSIRI